MPRKQEPPRLGAPPPVRRKTSEGRGWSLVNARTRGKLRHATWNGRAERRANARAARRGTVPAGFRKMPGQRGARWRAWRRVLVTL